MNFRWGARALRLRAAWSGSAYRLPPFAAVPSLLCGALVFFLFYLPSGGEPGVSVPGGAFPAPGLFRPFGGWAVLATGEAQDDRLIRESLARGGIEGVISESSQEIPVDDFGALKMVSLDSFRDEIEAFDPRDTGFAAKLRAFFVRDGQRFFFFPRDRVSGIRTALLRKRLGGILGDTPFTLSVLGHDSPFLLYFAALAAACLAALYFSRAKGLFAHGLPALLAFCCCGSFSFIAAALLLGTGELLREPLGELYAARRYSRGARAYAPSGFRGLREQLRPFRVNCALALLFAVLFAVFSAAGGFPALPLAAGSACFFFFYFMAFNAGAARAKKSGHALFTPVPLGPFRAGAFSLFPLLLPFGAVSALALALPALFPAASSRPLEAAAPADPRYFIHPDEYGAYLAFQSSFSYRPLEGPEAGQGTLNQEGYLRYYVDGDGLIAGSTDGLPRSPGPPFGLETLMCFLIDYTGSGAPVSDGGPPSVAGLSGGGGLPMEGGLPQEGSGSLYGVYAPVSGYKEAVPLALTAAVSALSLFRPGARNKKSKKESFSGDKRIAA